MSRDIFQARVNLTKIPTQIKQGNFLSAAQAMRSALQIITTQTLIRNESDEFRQLISQGGSYLSNSEKIRKLFPLSLEYKKGEEKELMKTLDELISMLKDQTTEDAKEVYEKIEKVKRLGVEKGRKELEKEKKDKADKTFGKLKKQFPTDPDLISEIAQAYMDSGMFEEASNYFDNSLELAPENIFALNRLAIALRRLGEYDKAEDRLLSAINLDKKDPSLYFNLGRLYLDWEKWDKGIESAKKACELNPKFDEAKKMLAYFQNKIDA